MQGTAKTLITWLTVPTHATNSHWKQITLKLNPNENNFEIQINSENLSPTEIMKDAFALKKQTFGQFSL